MEITRYSFIYLLLMISIVLLNVNYPSQTDENLEENYEPSNILLDTVHGNAKSGILILKNNFSCEETPFFPITSKVLSNYDLLIISEPEHSFFNSEIEAIAKFVTDGGYLVTMGGEVLNPLLSAFDVSVTEIEYTGKSYMPQEADEESYNFKLTDLEKNELTKNVNCLYFKRTKLVSGDFDLTASKSHKFSFDFYYEVSKPVTLIGVKNYGKGKLLVIGSFLDPSHDTNKILIQNFIPSNKFKNREEYNALYSYQKMMKNIRGNGYLDLALNLEAAWKAYFEGEDPRPILAQKQDIPSYSKFFFLYYGTLVLFPFFVFFIMDKKKSFIFLIFLLILSSQVHYYERETNPNLLIRSNSIGVSLISQEIEEKDLDDFISVRIETVTEVYNNYPSPIEILSSMRDDCDGQAILAASILENMGYKPKVVFGIGHAWVEYDGGNILSPLGGYYIKFNSEGIKDVDILNLIAYSFCYSYTYKTISFLLFGILLANWRKKIDFSYLMNSFILIAFLFVSFYFLTLISREIGFLSIFLFVIFFYMTKHGIEWVHRYRSRILSFSLAAGITVFLFPYISLLPSKILTFLLTSAILVIFYIVFVLNFEEKIF